MERAGQRGVYSPMTWLRWAAAVPLIVAFLILLAVLLPVARLNDTAANPAFYTDRLEQADMYYFVSDEALPAALDEIDTGELSDSPVDVSRIRDDLVSATRKILPPDWMRAQVEPAIAAFIPYVVGDTDSFTLTFRLDDRVQAAADVITEDIVRGGAFASVWSDVLSYVAQEVVENLGELPYSVALSEAEIEGALRSVLTEDWGASQAEAAIDSLLPYLTGEADHFTVTVQIDDRIDAAAEAVIDVLGRQETYDFLLEEMVMPAVEASIGTEVDLGYGIVFRSDEITAVIEEVLPPDWMQARLGDLTDSLAAFLRGDAESFEMAVALGDRKAAALDTLIRAGDEKLRALFLSLPECNVWQFLQAVLSLPPNTLPPCRPSGVSYEEAKGVLGIDVPAEIDRALGQRIPDEWTYTEVDLRLLLREQGNEDFLDDAREWVAGGWTFSDADLMDELAADEEDTLEDLRDWIANGYTVTEADLREAISDSGEDLDSFDDTRRWIHTGRTWLWAAWLAPFVLLIGIGLLGGRSWPGRLAWALAVLLVAALTIFVVTWAVYSSVGEPSLRKTFDTSDYEGVEAVLAGKGNEIAVDSLDAYASGIRGKALVMAIGSAVLLAGVVVWSRRTGHYEEREPTDSNT